MNTNIFYRWILFFINPFASLIISFREYFHPYAKNIFWAFCIYYGFTFSIGSESIGTDILAYIDELKYLYNSDFKLSDFFYYLKESGEVDILRTIISFSVSRFSDSQVLLTTIYAVIFGFFYSRNVWYVLALMKNKISNIEILMILVLILLIPIWFINGFRMWTAFHIYIYGLLPYIFENKKNKIIFVILSILVHFSFIVPVLIIFLYFLLGNQLRIYFILFLVSIFISNINIDSINSVAEILFPESILERSSSYRDAEVIDVRNSNSSFGAANWYVQLYMMGLKYSLIFSAIVIYLFGKKNILFDNKWRRLLSFVFVFFIVGNLLSNIPSATRFLNFAYFLTIVMILLYLNQFKYDLRVKQGIYFCTPFLLLFIVVAIRIGLYTTSLMTIVGNPFISLFNVGQTIPINDYIK